MNTDPLIGKTIGNFHIERMVGRGGMAQVYYGTDVKLQRPVAVKVIDARYRGKTAAARRFVKEARVMAKWRHENIVQIYYADDEGDLYYYAMEYVDGEDLSGIMSSYAADGELMPIADVIRIGRAVAGALDYAHEQQIIHRDVKPSNVLVARDGRVMLSDFGLALDLSDGSIGEAFGTANYISPEQAQRSADAVPQSDLYSLGIILYEMLTGVVPFNDPSPASVALRHISQPPPQPRAQNPELSADVEAVILKALEKRPEKRYQSGAELMDALEAALTAPKPSALTPLPPLPIGVPTVKRRAVSQNPVSARVASRPRAEVMPTVQSPGTVKREQSNSAGLMSLFAKLSPLWLAGGGAALCLLAIAFVWLARGALFANLPLQSVTPTTSAVEGTETLIVAEAASPSVSDATAMPSIVETQTPIPIVATSMPSAVPTATVRYPDGNRFIFYYTDNNFLIINKSRVARSISAFTFERLDDAGNTLNIFYGWRWEFNTLNISPKRCMAILIVNSPPYLEPVECGGMFASILYYDREDDADFLFWTTRENSHRFRVLWKDVEAGRCEIEAGVCEVLVP